MEPYSIKVNETNKCQNDRIIRSKTEYEHQKFNVNEDIIFTYDVIYSYTNTVYEERFNKYFYGEKYIHSQSIYISGLIIFILVVILSYIYCRSIKSEIEITNEKVTSDDSINEYGWRNIAFDVFRRPYRSDFLAALIGTGVQLLVMTLYSLLFVAMGIIHPKSGGSYFTLLVMVYIFKFIIRILFCTFL